MTALGWLLASNESPEKKIEEATKALRCYGFDESKPLADQVDEIVYPLSYLGLE